MEVRGLRLWTQSRYLHWSLASADAVCLLLIICSCSGIPGLGRPAGARTSVPFAGMPTAITPCVQASGVPNPIVAENTCPGTRGWLPSGPAGPGDAIMGFAAPASVNVGDLVRLYVSTSAAAYKLFVYRLGWYQGLGARLLYISAPERGFEQPKPLWDPVTRMISCDDWLDPLVLRVPSTWVSGIYAVKLVSSAGYERYTSFVVRDDASRAAVLFQSSVLTYQAYNLWGGYDLYYGRNPKPHAPASQRYLFGKRSHVVSFDRPYDTFRGLGDVGRWAINLLRWMERGGYDVTYATDIDVDLHGDLLTRHKLLVVAGHDEYWSTAMRDHVTAARDAGVSLAFFGANDLYWHVRLQGSPLGPDREVVCYKVAAVDPMTATDPKAATVQWRQAPLNAPESAVLGEQFAGVLHASYPLRLAPGAAPFLVGTGLAVGGELPGLVGGEYDRAYQNAETPSHLVVLSASRVNCIEDQESTCPSTGSGIAMATVYVAPSGARVFDAGTFQWSWGLDDTTFSAPSGDPAPLLTTSNAGFQVLTANLLAYLLSVR